MKRFTLGFIAFWMAFAYVTLADVDGWNDLKGKDKQSHQQDNTAPKTTESPKSSYENAKVTLSERVKAVQDNSNDKKTSAEKMPYDSALENLVQGAVGDLAEKQGIEISEITVNEAAFVTWPDSAMGCREDGMQYMQMLTDGALVRLSAKGKTYNYHGDRTGPLFLCQRPGKYYPTDQTH